MVGMPTLQSDGHIVVLRRLLHKSFRIFPSILGLWQEMGKEFIFGKTFGGGTNLWDSNIQDYFEQSQLKIFSYRQFSVLLVPSLRTLISTVTFPILRQMIQKASGGHLIVCIYHHRFQMRDLGLYLLQGYLQSGLFFQPCPTFLIYLQFSLLSLYEILKSLLKSSPLSDQWHTRR